MGNAGYKFCRQCGFRSEEISFGVGFLGAPNNPSVREDIMSGMYGPRPRKVLEENPDAVFQCYCQAFRCRCGHFSSKWAVRIVSREGEGLYAPTMRCDVCGKRMRALEKIPGIEQCPRCDSIYPMEFRDTILWD